MQPLQNRANTLAVLALGTVSGILILNTPGWAAKLLGCIAGVTGISIHQRKQLGIDDYSDAVDFLASEIGESLGELAIAPALPKLPTKLLLKTLPPKYQTTAEILLQNYTDTDWLQDALRKGLIVCGNTGDGKTSLLNYLISYCLQADPETELTIIDPDYGSSHGDSEPNTWMGLPVGRVVFIDEEVGVQVFIEAAREVGRRSKQTSEAFAHGATRKPYFKPRLIVADEALEVLQSNFETSDEDLDFDKANSRILFRGLKQKVRPIWGVQSLLCKQLNLDETQISQVNIILLGNAAYNKQNLAKLGLTGAKADEAIAQLKTVRQLPGCEYPCLVRINGEISVRALPQIDLSTLTIELPTELDPMQQWWSEVATESTVEEARNLIKSAPGLKNTRLQVMQLFGLEEQQCRKGRKDYDKYQFFKPQYDQWTKSATVAIKPPDPITPPPDPQPVTREPSADRLVDEGLIFVPETSGQNSSG